MQPPIGTYSPRDAEAYLGPMWSWSRPQAYITHLATQRRTYRRDGWRLVDNEQNPPA